MPQGPGGREEGTGCGAWCRSWNRSSIRGSLARPPGMRRARRQPVAPLRLEHGTVSRPYGQGRAARRRAAPYMRHDRPGFVDRLSSPFGEGEAEVHVLEVGGRVNRVEPSGVVKGAAPDEKARGRGVVDEARLEVLRARRIVPEPAKRRGTITVEYRARFLKRAVRV